MITVIIKEPNKKPEVKQYPDYFSKNDIEKIINCDWTDRVTIAQNLIMYVDDTALIKKLPLNLKIRTNNKAFPIQHIYGTVVVIRRKIIDDDFDFVDITQEDIDRFNKLLQDSLCL